tara:strand:+ start:454 stop:630 length:177 start_codon:yes stop_codon:yes gene_type:complete
MIFISRPNNPMIPSSHMTVVRTVIKGIATNTQFRNTKLSNEMRIIAIGGKKRKLSLTM